MICDFTQRWTKKRRAVYQPVRECIRRADFEVAPIDERTAKAFVLNYHYSNSYPSARRRFGLFEKGELCGVAVYSHPMNEKTITNVFNCERGSDAVELGRLVIRDEIKFNAESFLIGYCNRALSKEGFVGCVSFADDVPRYSASGEKTFAGHLGICYAATNSAYLSRSSPGRLHLLPDGTVFSNRTISKIRAGESGWAYGVKLLERFGALPCPEEDSARRNWLKFWLDRLTRPMSHPGNLRYGWSFRKKLELKSLPYPKIRFGDVQPNLCFGN